ncbi:TlpA disulfide reductase family protein [Agromyces sp. LHK192]|uniref:TlpA family protein disulfide reductase n=1 Tax=Agromyces sp. LHK192 TaxID=2498704 RepID=UPI000FDA279C|nr:TlpA disulfide reductase family protein [Agromyces sp. LHK192]
MISSLAVAAAFALAGCSSTLGGADAVRSGGGATDATAAESVPAPHFTAELADGTEVDSDELFAGRVTLVQFMASWCTQCVDQAELLTDTAQEHGDDVQVVFVGAEQDEPADLQAFLRDHAPSVPVVVDPDGSLFERYAVVEPPVTAVIDASGGIVRMWPGGATEADLRTELDALLG